MVEGHQPHASRRDESDHVDCQIRHKGLGRSRILQGTRTDEIKPGKCWRGTWQTKEVLAGRMLAVDSRKFNLGILVNFNYPLSRWNS